MKKNKKKAFTLVELLAVIVILAVILIIAMPQIMNTIKTTRLKSIEGSAKLIATNAEKDYLSQQAINQNYNAASIPCTDVAKLSDDYSSCRITYNDSGVATVKLKGASGGKFSGITCTGTKDNMDCRQGDPNAPEYVYSDFIPQKIVVRVTNEELCKSVLNQITGNGGAENEMLNNICTNSFDIDGDGSNFSASSWLTLYYPIGYQYTVTDSTACKDWFLYEKMGYNPGDSIDIENDNVVTKICDNNSNVLGDGRNSSYFLSMYGTYDELSAFATQNDNLFDDFLEDTNESTAVSNYSEVDSNVFTRWPGDADKFDLTTDRAVCIKYQGNTNNEINCFEYGNYEYEKQHLANVFGKDKCTGTDIDSLALKDSFLDNVLGIENVYAAAAVKSITATDGLYSCAVDKLGTVLCTYDRYGIEMNKNNIKHIYPPGSAN